jgi:hypothetical protein
MAAAGGRCGNIWNGKKRGGGDGNGTTAEERVGQGRESGGENGSTSAPGPHGSTHACGLAGEEEEEEK